MCFFNWSICVVGARYSSNFYFTSAHTCSIGFKLDDWGSQVSTSKFCIDNLFLIASLIYLQSISCQNITQKGQKGTIQLFLWAHIRECEDTNLVSFFLLSCRWNLYHWKSYNPSQNYTTFIFNHLIYMTSL